MAAKPQVTITLGRSGRVVKRPGASSEVIHSDHGRRPGGKRPIRERLGSNSDACHNLSQGKRQRSDYCKCSLIGDDHWIGQNDLRFKLMCKNMPMQTNMDADVHELDIHEKHYQTAPMSVRVDGYRHETESKTAGSVQQIPLRTADGLLHTNSLRKSFPWPLDGFGHRSLDKLQGAYSGISQPRNYCDELRQVSAMRSVDPPRSTPVLAKGMIDAPRPATFASKARAPVEHPKPVMQLLPNGISKTSYMAEEPTSLGSLLNYLGLGKYAILFEAEEVDMAALKQMGDNDLKELGIPMGPRKKILLAVSSRPRQRHA